MARRTRKSNELTPTPRFQAPREERVVSSMKRPGRKRVPRICLSGAWLEQAGFRRGVEFLVLADLPNQILLALMDP